MAPFFESEIEDIQIKINEFDQINGKLSLFNFKSPKVEDEEEDAISIEAKGYLAINGTKMTINRDSFSLEIDQQLLRIGDAGQHEIEITLKDDGPMPKFDNLV
jgi:hypothetical protein